MDIYKKKVNITPFRWESSPNQVLTHAARAAARAKGPGH